MHDHGASPEVIDAMPKPLTVLSGLEDHFDYSTPEAEAAMRDAIALVLDIREEVTRPLARRIAMYERTLGLAVVPVLLRRAALAILKRSPLEHSGHR